MSEFFLSFSILFSFLSDPLSVFASTASMCVKDKTARKVRVGAGEEKGSEMKHRNETYRNET